MEEEIMKKKYLFAVIIILMAAPRAWAVCDTLNLQASIVKAYFASESRSALRLATIDEQKLRLRGASHTFPELLKGLPSVWARNIDFCSLPSALRKTTSSALRGSVRRK